jgi:hypothetical protein
LLGSDFLDTTLEVGGKVILVHAWHEERGVGKEVVHLLKWSLGSLGQEAVEEDGVGQVTDLWSWSVVGHDSLEYSGKTYDKQ